MKRRVESTAEMVDAPTQPTLTPLGELVVDAARSIFAGGGVSLVAVVLVLVLGRTDWLGYALAAGLFWTGAQLAGRHARNPLAVEARVWQANAALRNVATLEAQVETLTGERDRWQHEAANAREAAAHWQRVAQQPQAKTFVPPQSNQETEDAWDLLCRRYLYGEEISKEYMARNHRWPSTRYLNATALLADLGFFTDNNRWQKMSMAEARVRWAGRGER